MMERSLWWMYVKREVLKSHLGDVKNNNKYSSREERAFAEDAARILGGSIWPPRSYTCTFCKREFRSAQALGGHMNIHRKDRARLKHNLSPHNYHHHKKNDSKPLLGDNDSTQQIDCYLSASSITTKRLSPARLSTTASTQENCGGKHNISPCFNSSFSNILGQNKSPISESDQGVVNIAKEYNNGLGWNNFVETNSSNVDRTTTNMSCKRFKPSFTHSLPVFLKQCSNAKLMDFQPPDIVVGHNHEMEDLDLELRLGKQQKKVKC